MKKRKIDYRIVLIVILLLILVGILCFYFLDIDFNTFMTSNDQTTQETTVSEVAAEIQTITNTLSSTGEIKSALEENLDLHASYYLKEILVETNQKVVAGEKLISYTNGTYMTAPYDCIITNLTLPNLSEQCTNQHYITVNAVNSLQMNLSMDETEIDKIAIGQEAQITTSINDKKDTGYVTKISSTATNGKFSVTVQFENSGNLQVGMTGTCEIILEKAENVVAVPVEAVTTTKGVSYVTIVETEGNTIQKEVTTGISNNAYIEIKEGLEEGEVVQIVKSENSNSNGFNRNNSSRNEKMQEMMEQGGERPEGMQMPAEMPSKTSGKMTSGM